MRCVIEGRKGARGVRPQTRRTQRAQGGSRMTIRTVFGIDMVLLLKRVRHGRR